MNMYDRECICYAWWWRQQTKQLYVNSPGARSVTIEEGSVCIHYAVHLGYRKMSSWDERLIVSGHPPASMCHSCLSWEQIKHRSPVHSCSQPVSTPWWLHCVKHGPYKSLGHASSVCILICTHTHMHIHHWSSLKTNPFPPDGFITP